VVSYAWLPLLALISFDLGVVLTLLAHHRQTRPRFDSLPDLPTRSVTRWPPNPVRILTEPQPVFYDAEAEGWWSS
jgi:hypothetical protein